MSRATLEGAMSSAVRFECVDPDVGEQLPFYVEGRLTGDERRIVAAHLQACARCAEDEAPLRDAMRAIASLRADPEPLAALDLPVARRARRPLLFAGAAALAALAIFGLASWRRPAPRDDVS